MRADLLQVSILGVVLGMVNCGPDEPSPIHRTSNTDVDASARASGGSSATAGSKTSHDRDQGAGGSIGAGGSVGAGGSDHVGNESAGGNSPSAGGTSGRGAGGSKATGGDSSSAGGASGRGAGGSKATGGSGPSVGGRAGTSAGVGIGGKVTTGARGGSTGTGGSGEGTATESCPTITTSCSDGQKTVTSNQSGTHCGYTYQYWVDSGGGTMTLKPGGFSMNYSNINDLLGREGRKPGTGNEIVSYSATFEPKGNSYLGIYGWTTNPLVEYYIVEAWGDYRPPGGQGHTGSFTTDGGTYDLYKVSRNGANIQGNGPFSQYWSVRTAKKTCGTITVANHFNAWKTNGMSMGALYEVSMLVEGYQSGGSADVKFSMQ